MLQYTKLVDKYLTKPDPADLNRDPMSVHPSAASVRYPDPDTGEVVTAGSCMRKEWYKRRDMQEAQRTGTVLLIQEEDPESVWRMAEGNASEDAEMKILSKMGILVDTQFGGKIPELNLSFRVDAIVVDPDTAQPPMYRGDQVGIELKSTHGWSAGKVLPQLAPKIRPAAPLPAHVLQTGLYVWYFVTKKPAGMDVSYFLLVYRDRGTGKSHQYTIVYDKASDRISVDGVLTPFHVEDILNRFKQLQGHVTAGTVPDRDYQLQYSQDKCEKLANITGRLTQTQVRAIKKGEYQGIGDVACKYCPWAGECWAPTQSQIKSPLVSDEF